MCQRTANKSRKHDVVSSVFSQNEFHYDTNKIVSVSLLQYNSVSAGNHKQESQETNLEIHAIFIS